MPDVPPAVATVGAIIGANLAVTLLWKYVPPSWRLLNRYFVIVPFYPSSLGMLGSTFSHQTWRHLGTNMMVLAIMGTRGKQTAVTSSPKSIVTNISDSA
jgi:rhomboid-like protein